MPNIDCVPVSGVRFLSNDAVCEHWRTGGKFISHSGTLFSVKNAKQLISEGFLGVHIEYETPYKQLSDAWVKL